MSFLTLIFINPVPSLLVFIVLAFFFTERNPNDLVFSSLFLPLVTLFQPLFLNEVNVNIVEEVNLFLKYPARYKSFLD